MLTVALTLIGASAPAAGPPGKLPDPLAAAIAHYQTVGAYRVTIHSIHNDGEEHIVYYYKRPGYVRMEFINPHSGALLVYNPHTGRVRLWPFGTGHFPELNLSPGNPLIQSPRGQHVDHSDVGALFENIRALQQGGSTEVLGEETVGGRTMVHLLTTGAGNSTIDGVHQFEMWLDAASQFPAKVISRDARHDILETVTMNALEIDPALPEKMFDP